MKFALKLLNLAGLLGSVAWLTSAPSWESFVTFIILLETYLGFEVSSFKRVTDVDKSLFAKFIEEFPPDGVSVRFLNEHDIGASFESSRLNDIGNFLYHWNDAAHEFHDKEAEWLRSKLYNTLNKFTNKLNANVSGTHRIGWLSMGIEDFETRQDLLKERDSLNEIASEAYQQYQDLVRLCRKFK